jgi:redox-sensitive bicupin YhaK (pirin superfamily)
MSEEVDMIARKIVRRTRGNRHGQIVRLMSPSDLGQVLKPFVFLDHFDLQGSAGGTELHPHSGIATVTYLFEGTIRYEDSNGSRGVVPAGGVEWFKAAHGAWHAGGPGDTGRARGFQLWLALPPGQELGDVENVYLSPDTVERDGPARVLVGKHGSGTSRLDAGVSLNYLAVRLRAGESWVYQPADDHNVGWISVSRGRLQVPEPVESGELAILESSNVSIEVVADSDAEFVIGSAVHHPYDLALGNYSVHTSAAALRAGEQRLTEIQRRLQSEGRL